MRELGEYLRREREARGISLDEIQEITKIRVRYLEAIERGELQEIPGETYVRGFLRNYARAVGLDGQAVLERYKSAREAAERAAAAARAEAAKAEAAKAEEAEAARLKEAEPASGGPPGQPEPGEPATAATRAALNELLRAIEARRTNARVHEADDQGRPAKAARLEMHRFAEAEEEAALEESVVDDGELRIGEGVSERVRARQLARWRRLWQVAAIAGAVAFLLGLWTGASRRARIRTTAPPAPSTTAHPAPAPSRTLPEYTPAPAEAPTQRDPARAEPETEPSPPAPTSTDAAPPRESRTEEPSPESGGPATGGGTPPAVNGGVNPAIPESASGPPASTREPGAAPALDGSPPSSPDNAQAAGDAAESASPEGMEREGSNE